MEQPNGTTKPQPESKPQPEPQVESKSIMKQVFGDMMTKEFMVKATVNFLKAFLHSFLITVSGHIMYYVSDKLSSTIMPPKPTTGPFGMPQTQSAHVGAYSHNFNTTSNYPVLASPRGDERFPGFIK